MAVIAKKGFDVEKLRSDFPLLQTMMNGKPIAFLDSAASSQKPTRVIEAMDTYYREKHANVHRGVYQLSQEATTAYENARELARAFINAPSAHEVIFVRGCTEGINLVAATFGRRFLDAGSEVLISAMEHHSNIVPWQMACEDKGAKLKVIPVNEKGELVMEEFERLLSDKVKIVAITHVSNTLGTINPIE